MKEVKVNGIDYRVNYCREHLKGLTVNSFEFIGKDNSINYLVDIACYFDIDCNIDQRGYRYGITFSQICGIPQVLIDMDNISCTESQLLLMKDLFEEHYNPIKIFGRPDMDKEFDEISNILYTLFDYSYDYLVKNGFSN